MRAVCTGQKPYVNYLNLKMKNPVFTYTYKDREYTSVLGMYNYRKKKEYVEGTGSRGAARSFKSKPNLYTQPWMSLFWTERSCPFLVFAAAGLWMILA